MFGMNTRRVLFALVCAGALAGCSSNGAGTVPASSGAQAGSQNGSSAQSYTLHDGNARVTVTVQAPQALPASSLTLTHETPGTARVPQSVSTCPPLPVVKVLNPFPFPLTIRIPSLTFYVPCVPSSPLFGATIYQLVPQPDPVIPVKIGDAAANGNTIAFTASAKSITLAPRSLSQITVLPEQTTADIAFPVAPGASTVLTANAPNLPSQLSFDYKTASGGTTYSAACFPAFNGTTLAQALQNVPLVGIPSFYCHITPANNATITFGDVVTFAIGDPKPDRSIFEPDGAAQGFECTLRNACNVPQFSVPTTYDNFIASNALDLAMCVPAQPNVDCNNVAGDPQGGSLTSVQAGHEFQLFVADDPTYKPGTSQHPVPWDGLFRLKLTGPCHLDTAADPDNGDHPPHYTDSGQTGVGPNAEYDVIPTGEGTCAMTVSEDPKYITDFSDPSNPEPRSLTLSIPVTGISY